MTRLLLLFLQPKKWSETLRQIFTQISINLYMICVFCLFTRVYLQYYCICSQQYWRLVLQFIFNNFVNWCKIFAMKNLFSIQLQKNCNHPPHQSLTSNNNSPSLLQTTPLSCRLWDSNSWPLDLISPTLHHGAKRKYLDNFETNFCV